MGRRGHHEAVPRASRRAVAVPSRPPAQPAPLARRRLGAPLHRRGQGRYQPRRHPVGRGSRSDRAGPEKLVFVQASIADELVARLATRVEALPVGMPWDEGVAATPLPEDSKLTLMREYLDDALARGARVANPTGGRGTFSLMRPAVVYPVKEGMRLYHEEQFGPLLAVARFSDVDEVLEWQRRSPYGCRLPARPSSPSVGPCWCSRLTPRPSRPSRSSPREPVAALWWYFLRLGETVGWPRWSGRG